MLTKKIIIVTGAAGLIGRSLVKTFLKYDAIVIATDIDKHALDRLKNNKGYKEYKSSLYFCNLDITDKDSISSVIKTVKDKYGVIDAIINNAYPKNKAFGKKLEDVTYYNFTENLALNIGGYFLVAQQFCMFFKKQGHGVILNMASIYGVITPRFEVYNGTNMTMPVEYAAIKSAIINLTKYFAQYYKKSGIRINALSPGGVLDGQSNTFLKKYNDKCSSKGMLNPKDISEVAAFLISESSSYIQGQNLVIDDGFSL